MTVLVLDIRANGIRGIARYGRRLLIEQRDRLADLDAKVYAVVRGRDLPQLGPLFAPGPIELVSPPPAADEDRFLHSGGWIDEFTRDVRPDLYYTINYTMSPYCPGPFVFTIHDLIRLELPEAATDEEFAAKYGAAELQRLARLDPAHAHGGQVFARHFEAVTRGLAARATRVATVSAASAADITTLLGVPPSRICIVPSAVEEVFHRRDPGSVGRVRSRLSVGHGPYFLYVGMGAVHKQVDWLVRQFIQVAGQCPPGTRLVITGGHAQQLAGIQQALTMGWPGQVIFTGWVSDDDLASLYSGAAAYLSASAKEGFGLPPAEAMACGAEAIVTDIPAHREVLGEHAHYYTVGDGTGLQKAVIAAAHGELPRRAPGFSPPAWPAAASAFTRAIHEALASA